MTIIIDDGSEGKKELTPEQRRHRAKDLMTHLERRHESFQKAERSIHLSEDNSNN